MITEPTPTPTTLVEAYKTGRNQAMEFVKSAITKAIDNPTLEVISARMALQVLLASLPNFDEDEESE